MTTTKCGSGDKLVLAQPDGGVTLIPTGSALTRLNYFDGKFLRAADLKAEQDYLRSLVQLSNQAGGPGVVRGFNVSRTQEGCLKVGPGLAIDRQGRVLLLPVEASVDLAKLTGQAEGPQPEEGNAAFANCPEELLEPELEGLELADVYVITIGHAEGLCGHEDVYGRLCEEACVGEADRPWRVEGIVVAAYPLVLHRPLPDAAMLQGLHLRSRVASAYFRDEIRQVQLQSHISREGLLHGSWCAGSLDPTRGQVAIAVVGMGANAFLDPWIARRERQEAPSRRYWAWRMGMRPWNAYLAQILQFQCHLVQVLEGAGSGNGERCVDERAVLRDARTLLGDASQALTSAGAASAELAAILARMEALDLQAGKVLVNGTPGLPRRVLLDGGIMELPSAGYLPVDQTDDRTLRTQVRDLLGPGVDLRFCAVRPDFVAHALEEAQHMERISLVQGIVDPQNKPQVDILVPDGEFDCHAPVRTGTWYEIDFAFDLAVEVSGILIDDFGKMDDAFAEAAEGRATLEGVGRSDPLEEGGGAFHLVMGAVGSGFKSAEAFLGAAAALSETQPKTAADFTEEVSKVSTRMMDDLRKTVDGPSLGLRSIGTADLLRFFRADPTARAEARKAAAKARAKAEARAAEAEPTPEATARTADDAAAVVVVGELDTMAAVSSAMTALNADTLLVWSGMRSARDPFSLVPGDVTPVDGEVIVTGTTGTAAAVRVWLDGELAVTSVTPGTVRSVAGELTGRLGFEMTFGTGAALCFSFALPATAVELRRRESQGAWILHILIGDGPTRPVIRVNRPDAPRSDVAVRAGVHMDASGLGLYLVRTGLDEDRNIGLPADMRHQTALAALDLIGQALQRPKWAEQAGSKLFPREPVGREEYGLTSPHSWVLFHRRRCKECGCAVGTKPAVSPQGVWAVGQEWVDEVRSSVLAHGIDQDSPLFKEKQDKLAYLGTVDFVSGSDVLDAVDASTARRAMQDAGAVMGGDRRPSRLVVFHHGAGDEPVADQAQVLLEQLSEQAGLPVELVVLGADLPLLRDAEAFVALERDSAGDDA